MSAKKFNMGGVPIDLLSYGSQGSAVLGIRDSGKTYTATLLAEKIFEAGIPFVAFDPIGVWRFLRVPGKGKGYPIVVAGGQDGDLPLTVNSAPEIVRAAMRNGVSLVIDLYDINLSKADWKRIVTACVRVLLHENGKHGLRHVFIEEAAEFAPQRVGPDQGQVYAEIEKLARMGGNARLGYTLINQRAEEVNKAVLELCDNLFLHRQKGRNSLTSLSKWLDIGNVKDHKKIVDTLATLPTGKCWAWMAGTEEPILVKVPEKNSLHPDRRAMRGDKEVKLKSAVDVNSFVSAMRNSLGKVEAEAKENDPVLLKKRIAELQAEMKKGGADPAALEAAERKGYAAGIVAGLNDGVVQATEKMQGLIGKAVDVFVMSLKIDDGTLSKMREHVKRMDRGPPAVTKTPAPFPVKAATPASINGLSGPEQRILRSLTFWKSIGHDTPSKAQVAAVAGYSPIGGAFGNPIGKLRGNGLIDYPAAGRVTLVNGRGGDAMSHSEATDMLMSILSGPEKRIIAAFDSKAHEMTRAEVAAKAGYEPVGGAFGNPVGRLCTLGILSKPAPGRLTLAPWAAELLA